MKFDIGTVIFGEPTQPDQIGSHYSMYPKYKKLVYWQKTKILYYNLNKE
jgi:hypothetical protein